MAIGDIAIIIIIIVGITNTNIPIIIIITNIIIVLVVDTIIRSFSSFGALQNANDSLARHGAFDLLGQGLGGVQLALLGTMCLTRQWRRATRRCHFLHLPDIN